jgi:hypothetical protein
MENQEKVIVYDAEMNHQLCHVDATWDKEKVVNFLHTHPVGSGSYCAGGRKVARIWFEGNCWYVDFFHFHEEEKTCVVNNNAGSEVYDYRNAPSNPCSRCGCSDDRMCLCC